MSSRMIDQDAAWDFADALDPVAVWSSPLVLVALYTAPTEGRSIDEILENLDGMDAFELYWHFGRMHDAAEATGIELPWEVRLEEGQLVLCPTDRAERRELLEAVHHRPHVDVELDNYSSFLRRGSPA